MTEIIEMISNFGITIVIVAYFLYKDAKFNNNILTAPTETKLVLTMLKDLTLGKGNGSPTE